MDDRFELEDVRLTIQLSTNRHEEVLVLDLSDGVALHRSNQVKIRIVGICNELKPFFVVVFYDGLNICNSWIKPLNVFAGQHLVKIAEAVRANVDALVLSIMTEVSFHCQGNR